MYTIGDKIGATRNIQEKLRIIGETESIDALKSVVSNGDMDEKTKNAVNEFQGLKSLERSGAVDLKTFEALVNAYRIALYKSEAPESIAFPLKLGDFDTEMLTVNTMLKAVSESYFGASDVIATQYFSESTERAVKELQRAFLHKENGEIDGYFYSRLTNEIKSLEDLDFFRQ